MTSVELSNPSAFCQLKIFSQDRMRNTFEQAPAPAAPAPKRETRAELEKRGSAVTTKSTRISTKHGSEQRDVPMPQFQALGYETLQQFVTEISEKQLRESQQAAVHVPPVQHVRDSWGALTPRQSVPPGGKVVLQLEEHTRLAVSCDGDEVMLQVSNTSPARTLRLRTLDLASKEAAHCAWIPPAKEYPAAAIVSANGTHAAVIELQAF